MKSRKKLLCLAVAASLVMGAAFTGCITTDNEKDAKQTIAVVNISSTDAFAEEFGEEYKATVTDKVYLKRDMMTAYYNSNYNGNVSYGQSNAEMFESIKDSLVSTAVTTQYATVYMLKAKVDSGDGSVIEYLNLPTEAKKYEYILGGEESTAVKSAVYSLQSTLNSVLDSSERKYIENKDKDDEYSGSETRSTPSGIDATEEDYVPEGYGIYTGYKGYLLSDMQTAVDNKDYEPLDGTTRVTRQKAYAAFLGSLDSNYLLTEEDKNTTDIWKLSYVQESYVSQLQSEIISEFQDKIKEDQEDKIQNIENDVYTYVKDQYDDLLDKQSKEYDSKSAFESAMGSLSDTKFVLYSPSTENDTEEIGGAYGTFGYVYNILLPFSKVQEGQLSTLQSLRDNEVISQGDYFIERNKLLKNIVTTDQRAAWFNGSTDYSFDASETELNYYGKDAGRNYLFFENNLTDSTQYKPLEKYAGLYTYNGTVKKNTNGSYTLIPNKLNIDVMMEEFEAYINHVLGGGNFVTYEKNTGYYAYEASAYTKGETKEVDYAKLVYGSGKVDFDGDGSKENMFAADSKRYKAMSAVNELQYAYTTDTGVLSQYIGYTVSAYDTNYIKEFEYAAQQAVREGAGSFKICAGDYGWHLLYVTETFDTAGGAVYKNADFSKTQVEKEGTFENRFYNWIKDTHLAKEVTLKNNKVLKEYNTEKAVKVYKNAYKDLGE
ncbi:MAG: hypothetical protein K2K04_01265 [Clostridia bacterium]|nr:hypothetical protein [Clostridia bacterium]